jgi:hypothetical protein
MCRHLRRCWGEDAGEKNQQDEAKMDHNLRGVPDFKRSETFNSKTQARKKHPIVEENIVIMVSRTKRKPLVDAAEK